MATADFLSGGGEMGALMRAMDWSDSPLGPPEKWPQSLRTSVSTCLNSAFPIVMWWGRRLTQLYNDGYVPMLGIKHPAALGAPARTVWGEIWPTIGPMFDRVVQQSEGVPAHDLLLLLERRGEPEECYFSFSYSPILDEAGNVGGVFCPVIETTDRVIGERRLRLLRLLAERCAEPQRVDEICRTACACIAAEAARDFPFAALYLGDREQQGTVRLAAVSGNAAGHMLSPETLSSSAEGGWPISRLMSGSETGCIREIDPASSGSLCGPWQVPPRHAAMLTLGGGAAPAGLLLVGLNPHRPIGEVRGFGELAAAQIASAIANALAYQQARERAEALAEIDRAKTMFFSNISHEFRTPLTLMLSPLEGVLNDSDGDALRADHRQQLELAHRNSLRLLKLVNALLDFSRIEAGRMQASYAPTDLAALTADLASGFRSAIERAGLFLDLNCRPLPEPVFLDGDMWEKVVLNLLSNALKFTFEGGISVTVEADRDAALVTVRDTGVGVPAQELPRLFERFHRIEQQRSRSFEGSGIGLALTQELVRLHGGEISARSEPGRGTALTIRIPFGTAHLPSERIGVAPSQTSTAARVEAFVAEALEWIPDVDAVGLASSQVVAAVPESGSGTRACVLLADDNGDMRAYIQRLLAGRYEVTAVADGLAALDALRRRRADLVLSDIMMPRLDGFGLLREIRADPALREIPVILLSARAGEEARIHGLDAGADDYVVKPFSAHELLARIGATLSLARLRREASAETRERTSELETVLATIPVAVWFTHDREARVVRGNRAAARLLRMKEGANASLSNLSAEGPMHFQVFRQGAPVVPEQSPLHRAARGEVVATEELEISFSDGSGATILIQAVPILDQDGDVRGAISVAADITDRKEAESDVQAAEEQLRLATEAAEVGFWDVDPINDVLIWPPRVKAMFGIPPDVPVSMADFYAGLHPEDREATSTAYAAACDPGRRALYDVEYRTVGKEDGIIRWVAAKGRALFSNSGLCIRVIGTAIDVTARKQVEATLAQSQMELQRLNETLEARVADEIAAREQVQARLAHAQRMEALGQLAGGIAHDFNNVLQAIGGGLSLIERRADRPEAVRSIARMASDAAERGATITNRLLAFARRGELRAAVVAPHPMLEGLREMLANTLGPNITVKIEVSADTPALFADKAQLETVLVNLAVNARDAMPAGGVLTISAAAEMIIGGHADATRMAQGDYVRIAVADTGVGMEPAVLSRASEPFFTTKPPGQGTGLGLAMARGFAEQSGGGFAIRSTLGRGTTASLWFPRARASQVTGAGESDVRALLLQNRARTLLVDDDVIVRTFLAQQLVALGHQVQEAADGLAALARLDAGERPDLLVTDFAMPGMNGLMLIDEARVRIPDLPAMLLTGFADTSLREIEAAEDERTVVLRKPVSEHAISDRVAALLQRGENRATPKDDRTDGDAATAGEPIARRSWEHR